MEKDKQKVQKMLDKLVEALRMTSDLYDVVSLEYAADRGLVYALFASGVIKPVDINGGAGASTIVDVISEIGNERP